MGILVTESFVGVDADPIGGNWGDTLVFDTFQRLSNTARGSAAAPNVTYWSTSSAPNDQYTKLVLNTFGGAGGVLVRASSDGTKFYLGYFNGSTAFIYVYNSGYSALTSGAYSPNPGDIFEGRAIGTTISLWVNSVQILTTTDATIASGQWGMYAADTGIAFDSFEGGDFGHVTSQWQIIG